MTTLTFNVWLTAAAALLSATCSFTAIRLAVRVSSSPYTRKLIWLMFSGATAVGFGLWCVDIVSILAFSSPVFTPPVVTALLLAIPAAAAGQIAALLFLTVRKPSLGRIAISGAVAALGISLAWSVALQAAAPDFTVIELMGSIAVGALLWTVALAFTFHRRNRRRATANCMAVLAGSLALLTPVAATFIRRQAGFGFLCGIAPCDGVGLLTLTLLALGSAPLVVTSVITVYGGRLEARARRSASEVDEVHARLQYLATHDSLTGLPNWALFKERLAQAVTDTGRPGRALAVVVIDLDRFSSFNHSLGHGAGDWLLTQVSRRIGMVIRTDHTFARLGSDEFVVLIDHVAARVEAKALTTRILEACILDQPREGGRLLTGGKSRAFCRRQRS